MKIKIIDYGYVQKPLRSHDADAGADVFATANITISAHCVQKMPLGFGLEIPNGYAGYIYPRSSLASKGIVCQIPPIDSGYTGEIIAIISNQSNYDYEIKKFDRIGQLVIMPVIIADFVENKSRSRGNAGFGSTGK